MEKLGTNHPAAAVVGFAWMRKEGKGVPSVKVLLLLLGRCIISCIIYPQFHIILLKFYVPDFGNLLKLPAKFGVIYTKFYVPEWS